MSTPTAAWPTRDLIGALDRAGGGVMDERRYRGARVVLTALANVLPYGSGAGHSTAYQLADTTGYSERWVRRCLAVLEDFGLITWTRGGVRDGRPQPSHFRIIKTALAAMVRAARHAGKIAQRMTARAADLAAKLKAANSLTLHATRRRAPHAELSSAPPSQGEATRWAGGSATRTERPPVLPHTLREFVGPRADALTDEQERRILRAEEAASNRYPGPRDAHMRRYTINQAIDAILQGVEEPAISDDGTPLDYTTCDVCSRDRGACERIPYAVSGHTFTPLRRKTGHHA